MNDSAYCTDVSSTVTEGSTKYCAKSLTALRADVNIEYNPCQHGCKVPWSHIHDPSAQ